MPNIITEAQTLPTTLAELWAGTLTLMVITGSAAYRARAI
jgi:hypothetical protein